MSDDILKEMGLNEDSLDDLVDEVDEEDTDTAVEAEKEELTAEAVVETEKQEEQADEEDVSSTASKVDESFVPKLNVSYQDINDAAASIKAGQDELKTLREKWDSGDIDDSEYRTEYDAVNEKIVDARINHRVMIETQKNNEAIQTQAWKDAQERFFAQKENAFYTDENSRQFKVLNTFVIDIANANPDRSGAWVLEEARKEVDELLGRTGQKQQPAKDFQTEGKRLSQPQDGLVDLGSLPEAAPQDVEDRYSYIDKITDPILAQKEIAKLSEEEREEYLG